MTQTHLLSAISNTWPILCDSDGCHGNGSGGQNFNWSSFS